ncbi:hypothetical protein RHGRI_033523 [Rhododendron griersonianum]|uniref:Uncharacterized protein n=1 Tax=Rhododendron griersonianum TaxID=479676 RepID=A0AAV6HX52_9ERIC|nr:hypothetical protein RHGRI_033523 [Rhododendron griersonianum]
MDIDDDNHGDNNSPKSELQQGQKCRHLPTPLGRKVPPPVPRRRGCPSRHHRHQ